MPLSKSKIILVICIFLLVIRFSIPAGTPGSRWKRSVESTGIEAHSLDDVQNRTLGFEKIFVINLPSRTDNHDALALSASMTDIQLDWVDGVRGDAVSSKALPFTESRRRKMSSSEIGSWRAHVNALEKIVEQNISTALIMEGDVDWDIRIKSQLRNFALASRALTQPSAVNPTRFEDQTLLSPNDTARLVEYPLLFDSLPPTIEPTHSVYGDNWDVLHLGHCAMRVPELASMEDPKWADTARSISKGHVLQLDDPTTAPSKDRHSYNDHDVIPFREHPDFPGDGGHSRMYHHSMDSLCTLAYAITQRGARKLLLNAAIEAHEEQFDFMLRDFCDEAGAEGVRSHEGGIAAGRHICLTTQPPLFGQYKPKGANGRGSDISKKLVDFSWGSAEAARTDNIRWSTRMNLRRLVRDQTDWVDQWPDKQE